MSPNSPERRFAIKIAAASGVLAAVVLVGTLGYKFIGGPAVDWVTAFYMTAITVTTVGYGEIIDLSGNPGGRLFTVFVLTAGLGALWFMFSALTAFLLESDLNVIWRRRRMEKAIEKLSGHYLICGFGRVGQNVAQELTHGGHVFVAIDTAPERLAAAAERFPGLMWLAADASDDDTLEKAGIARAAGVFAVTGEDSRNLMIALTAKQHNTKLRVVARAHEVRNADKMRRAGADAVVSPDYTGGMRIASEMVRPVAASFLDDMRFAASPVHIEEVRVPADFTATRLDALGLASPDFLLLGIRHGADWIFNPPGHHEVRGGETLILMARPEGVKALGERLAAR